MNDPQNKQELYRCTALTDLSLQWRDNTFLETRKTLFMLSH